jgi:hypothetical protein
MCPFMDRVQRLVAHGGRVVRPELVMTLPRSAADVLADHVLFEIEAIDRMYLNLYQPRLQHGAGIAAFFAGHRGHRFASSALMAPMTALTADIGHFIEARGLDLVRFAPGQRKDLVTAGYLQRAQLDDRGLVPAQVLYAGVAQEKQKVFRTSKRRNPVTGATYPWLVPGSGVVNQYYFYCVNEDFGPVCVKFSGYFPYTGRLILNGNEYAKRQAAKAGIGFVPLDNAFAAVDDVAAVQAICDGLDEDKITALAVRLLAMLPYPFTAEDTAAGYRYELPGPAGGPQPPRPGAPRRLVRVPAAAQRFHQLRPAHLPRAPAGAGTRGHDQRAAQLRPAAATHPRAHRAHPA